MCADFDRQRDRNGEDHGEHGTHETVKARFWPWLSGNSPQNRVRCSLFARNLQASRHATPASRKWCIVFRPPVAAVLTFDNTCLAQIIDFRKTLPRSWRGAYRGSGFDEHVPDHVFLESFCKSQFPRQSVNLFFILVLVKDKLTDLRGR